MRFVPTVTVACTACQSPSSYLGRWGLAAWGCLMCPYWRYRVLYYLHLQAVPCMHAKRTEVLFSEQLSEQITEWASV